MAQIIDENAKVCDNLENYLESIGITKAGLNYHTLSIIGAQSSGKSTLLNALFHTTFATMNEETGRQQTTKGIHAAFNDQNVLIFDIEGSDSRERGDADALFERKAALFGLALSEVVMVNMWENDIGRYNASSIPLLRTVFEVNLQLFATSQESKCHLLFVIRDSSHNDEIIEGQVKKDLDLIWKGLVLPPNLQGKKFEDFFIFHFFALPHLRLEPVKFKESAEKLAKKFTDPNDPDFFFAKPMGKLIPGDGLFQYINSVWEAISENRELNLPSQRKTLSNFRCEEFMNNALEEFEKSADEEIRSKIAVNSPPFLGFQEKAQEIVTKAINDYNQAAGKYVREIVVEKRQLLNEKMSQSLLPSFQLNSQLFRDAEKQKFFNFIEELPQVLEESEQWEMKANKARDETNETINKFIESSKLQDFNWEFNNSTLLEDLDKAIQQKLDSMQKDTEERIFSSKNFDYKQKINTLLEEAQQNMWEKMRNEMNNSIQETKRQIDEILTKNTINRQTSERLQSMFYKSTVSQVLAASEYVSQKMMIKFEEKFLQDENHNSRKWSPEDDISAEFEIARDAGMEVLGMFTNCQLREPGTPIPPNDLLTKQMLSPIKVQAIEADFNEQIEKAYVNAVRIRESMITHNEVPIWMWIIILITGYQKLVMVAHNPFGAAVIAILVGLIYFLYSRHKLDVAIIKVKNVITKVLVFLIDLLKKNTNELELPPSIRESAKKTVNLDKEALTKSIVPEAEVEDVTLDTNDSGKQQTDGQSNENSPTTSPSKASEQPHKVKRRRAPASNFATLQPNKINPADLQKAVQRRKRKHAQDKNAGKV